MPQAQATPLTEEKSDATAVPQVVETVHDRFGDPKNYINRELSWLAFNQRVLEEAQDPTQPLIERVKFLTIFSSNLDEFFEIRVAAVTICWYERRHAGAASRCTPLSKCRELCRGLS